MKCNKCNHVLPDDSEFCQYCGNKIEKEAVVPIEIKVEPPKEVETPIEISAEQEIPVPSIFDEESNIDDMSSDEVLNEVLKFQAQQTIKAMKENIGVQPDNDGDADFGLVPAKPIFTFALKSVIGEEEYLNNLRTTNGEKITYNRLGSTNEDGINGMIDIYETFLPSGQPYKTIYINMYGAKTSTKAPDGFVLDSPAKQIQPEPKKEKPVKTRYCSKCGSMIDNETKICTGCGKQYFKGFKFTKFSITVIVLALVIAIVSTFCVLQYINTQELNDKINDLEEQVRNKETTISTLENKIDNLEDEKTENLLELMFFKAYAEIVPDDGSYTYHKYGCPKLDDDADFWILNTDAAKQDYYKCSYCH